MWRLQPCSEKEIDGYHNWSHTPAKKNMTGSPHKTVPEREQIASDLLKYFESRKNSIDQQLYSDLRGVVSEYKVNESGAISLICRLMTLIDGQNDLVLGMNEFLPANYNISSLDLTRPGPKIMQLRSRF